jgi:hypothetical protein
LRLLAYLILLVFLFAIVWHWPVLWELAVVAAIGALYPCFFKMPTDSDSN